MRRALLSIVFLLLAYSGLQAGQDDALWHLEGLSVYRIADKELDNYNYASARHQYGKVLAGLTPEDTLQRIYGLAKLARAERRDNKIDIAADHMNAALELAEPYFSGDHAVLAFLYHEQGELARYLGRLTESEKYLQGAINMRSRLTGEGYGPNGCITAVSLQNLGELYMFELDDYILAEPIIQDAFAILDNCIADNTLEKALAYYNLASVYWSRNELEFARLLARGGLDILFEATAVNWDAAANFYNFMAIIASSDYNEKLATEYALRSLEIRERYCSDQVLKLAEDYVRLADGYISTGKLAEAGKAIDRAVAFYRKSAVPDENLYSELLFMRGRLYSRLGRKGDFLDVMQESIAIRSDIFGACHLNTAIAMRATGYMLYHNFNDFTNASRMLDAAIDCLRESAVAGKVYHVKELADNYYWKANMHLSVANSEVQGRKHHLELALQNYMRSDSVLRIHKAVSSWQSTKIDYAEEMKVGYDEAIQCAFTLMQEFPEEAEKLTSTVFDLMESNKSYLLFESIIRNLERKKAQLPDSIDQRLTALEGRIRILESDTAANLHHSKLSELNTARRELQAIHSGIEGNRMDDVQDMFTRSVPTLQECRYSLSDNVCILQYYFDSKDYYLLAVRRDSVLLRSVGPLDSLEGLLNLIADPVDASRDYGRHVSHFEQASFELYRRLVPAAFTGSRDLIIIPDGMLYYLPFEALVTETVGARRFGELQYLVRTAGVSYAYSTAQLIRMVLPDVDGGGVLGVFPDAGLAHTALEMEYIERRVRRSVFAGADWNREDILREMEGRSVVHIATHGYADTGSVHANYIELFHRERLYDHEISTVNMNSTLVFLNACETNLGKMYDGEGVFSLSKAFMQAGCPAVISSIWQIPDHSSAELAIRFYDLLGKEKTFRSAFTKARRAYLVEANDVECQPYYWAGIVYTGIDAPVDLVVQGKNAIGRRSAILLVAGILMFAVIIWAGYRTRRGKRNHPRA